MNRLGELRSLLKLSATKERAAVNARYFKSAPGEYGHGDQFMGLTVPATRAAAKGFYDLSLSEVKRLLASSWHEERLAALFILVRQFHCGDAKTRRKIFALYLRSIKRSVNNWDLVDASAPAIVGGYTAKGSKEILKKLARSKNLWERRVAIVATQHFIRQGLVGEVYHLADLLMHDAHDLIHKATGWMLREAGKVDGRKELAIYLQRHAKSMPRTMLRYALEHFPPAKRAKLMNR